MKDDQTLCMADFDDMAEKGIKQIIITKRKFRDFENTLMVKEVLQKEPLPGSVLNKIHTDFGNVLIRTEENYQKLIHGQEVLFDSPYDIGDLVQYRHGGVQDKNFKEYSKPREEKTHYSKIIRIMPFIDEDSLNLRLRYVMENARVVPFEDVLNIEKKGPLKEKVNINCPIGADQNTL